MVDGTVWYTGNRQAKIGKLNPTNGEIQIIPMPENSASDPHTLVFDQSGILWFTVQGGNFIGRVDRRMADAGRVWGASVRDGG